MKSLERSIREGNAERKEYWLERVTHLMSELNWIDQTIKELEAEAVASSNPPLNEQVH